jgi:hypothetical protein
MNDEVETLNDRDLDEWRRGAFAAETAISAARRSRDWEALDLLASAMGLGQSPADRGAWAAICDALCSGGLIRGPAE